MNTPPPLPADPNDVEHIRLLVIFHYIWAGLSLAGLLFLCFHFFMMSSIFNVMEDLPHKVVDHPPIAAEENPVESPDLTPDLPDQADPLPPLEKREVPEFDPKIFKGFFNVFIYFYVFTGVLMVVGAILNFMSARYLTQRRNRNFSMFTAGLNCFGFPLGTALGVFTFVVLSRASVVTSYQNAAGGTP